MRSPALVNLVNAVACVACGAALALCVAAPTTARAQTPEDELQTGDAAQDRLPRLVDALNGSSSFKIRATAAVALGRMGDARAVTPLADALRSDSHYAVRVAAASALGRIASAPGAGAPGGAIADAIPALLAALHDQDQLVRDEAQTALDRFHTPTSVFAFREALQSEDPVVRLAAVRAYGNVLRENAGVAGIVVNALGDDADEVARAAETALAGIPHERAVPVLVAALSTGGSQVRSACARLLAKRADKTAVEPLIALMTAADEGEDVRRAARDALRAHKEYLDMPARIAAAKDTTPAAKDARVAALRVVAAMNEPGAAEIVERALADADASVRVGAARAAVDLGGDKAKKMLEQARARETDTRTQRQLDLLLKSVR